MHVPFIPHLTRSVAPAQTEPQGRTEDQRVAAPTTYPVGWVVLLAVNRETGPMTTQWGIA